MCHPTNQDGYNDNNNGDNDNNNNNNNDNTQPSMLTLPWVNLETLLIRNLHRLKAQGRYIPATAIADCAQRVESLVVVDDDGLSSPTTMTWNGTTQPHRLEQRLVSLASPPLPHKGMDRTNTTTAATAPQFRFSLTNQRLIQKQYDLHTKNRNRHGYGREDNSTSTQRNTADCYRLSHNGSERVHGNGNYGRQHPPSHCQQQQQQQQRQRYESRPHSRRRLNDD
jgi:hypothetical protein